MLPRGDICLPAVKKCAPTSVLAVSWSPRPADLRTGSAQRRGAASSARPCSSPLLRRPVERVRRPAGLSLRLPGCWLQEVRSHTSGTERPGLQGQGRFRVGVSPLAKPPPAARQEVTGRRHTASQEFTRAVYGALAGGCLGRAVEGAGCRFAPLRGSRGEVAEVVRVARWR